MVDNDAPATRITAVLRRLPREIQSRIKGASQELNFDVLIIYNGHDHIKTQEIRLILLLCDDSV